MIRIEGLQLSVGSFALREIALTVPAGEYFVLLGPTGAGKTLLIESLCGLKSPDAGRVFVGGRDVTDLEPRYRGLGYLPQDYALFPHLTVFGNVAYGLRYGGLSREAIRAVVRPLLQRLGIEHLSARMPRRLSGGEQQRVALARALAVRPGVLLLDEPVSALDESTRDSLCRMLKQVQRDTQTTTLHICHSFVEMLSVADRVGILHQGRLVQIGTPRDVLDHPANATIARFVQADNILAADARVEGDRIRLIFSGGMQAFAIRSEALPVGAKVDVVIRPENVQLVGSPPSSPPADHAVLEARLVEVADLGAVAKTVVACGGAGEMRLGVSSGRHEFLALSRSVGDAVWVVVPPEAIHVMAHEGKA